MSPSQWQRRKEIFTSAMEAHPSRRDEVIDEMCAGDELLVSDVRRLVRNAGEDDRFLDEGPAKDRELAPSQVLCDRFELLRLVGEGGMGQVWAAQDRRLGETVAIKTVQSGLAADPVGLARFQRELQLARRIGHPNVCRVYELFEDTSQPSPRILLTMELLEGETLAARLKREGRLEPSVALRFFHHVAAGLHAAHETGVVHRDLKPSNIMLVPATGSTRERAVVMDFGLARPHEQTPDVRAGAPSLTQSGADFMGTPEYMAPEQIRGERATPATDVYALGLLVYEMLAGGAPFQGKNTMDSWMRRVREGPPKLAGAVPGLDLRVDQVIARCLEFEPAARFGTAAEAVDALTAEIAPAKANRRSPWRAAVVALAACGAAAVGWVVLDWQRRRAEAPPTDARRWYEDAQRDLSEGAAARAAAQLRRAIERAPRFAAAHAALAETQLELDQAYRARESIQRATDLAPDRSRLPESEALHIEGINRIILRDCPGAVESLRRRVSSMAAADKPTAAVSLARAYERCDMAGDAAKALEEAAAADPRNAAVRVRAAFLASRRREWDAAEKLLVESEALYRERGNYEGVGEVLATRGTLAADRDQLDQASAALAKALDLARTTGSVQQQVRVLLQQAIVARKRGDFSGAGKLTGEGLELARRGDLETLAMQGLFAAANVDFGRGRYDQAKSGFERALDLATRYRDEGGQARAWLSLASLHSRQAVPAPAVDLIAKARPFYEKSGNKRVLAQISDIENSLHVLRGEFGPVLAFHKRALEDAARKGDPNAQVEARRGLRSAYAHMGRWQEALEAGSGIPRGEGAARQRCRDLLSESEIFAALGRFADSHQAWTAAHALGSASGLMTEVEYGEAILMLYQGEHSAARQRFEALLRREKLDGALQRGAEVWRCRAASWGPNPKDAAGLCRDVLEQSRTAGRTAQLLSATLALAESSLRSGDGAASRLAAEVIGAGRDWGEASEWLWRAEAIASLSAGPGIVSPFPSVSRLGLTAGDMKSWSSRPDVARLIRTPRVWMLLGDWPGNRYLTKRKEFYAALALCSLDYVGSALHELLAGTTARQYRVRHV